MQVFIIEHLKTTWRLIVETYKKYDQDSCATLAAALAFHSFFSIFPLLLFLIYIGSQVLQTEGVRELLSSGLIQFLPTGGDSISEGISATLDLRGSIGFLGGGGRGWGGFFRIRRAGNRPQPYLEVPPAALLAHAPGGHHLDPHPQPGLSGQRNSRTVLAAPARSHPTSRPAV